MSAFESILAAARLPEKSVPLCLRGDLMAEVQALESQLEDSRDVTLADRGNARKVAEQIEALREEMVAGTYVFRVRGLSRTEWASLVASNPPRKDSDVDSAMGYNFESFFPALVQRCLIDPVLDQGGFDDLLDKLSDGQFQELADAAVAVCRRKVDVPFSLAASATLRSSGDSLELPDS